MPDNRIAYNDFEGLVGWGPALPWVTAEHARSGRFAAKVDAAVEYAATYVTTLGAAGMRDSHRLRLRLWALRKGSGSNGVVVVQLMDAANGSKSLFWQSLDINQRALTYNRWIAVEKAFELPESLGPTVELRVYLWRHQATQPTYIDDLEIAWDN